MSLPSRSAPTSPRGARGVVAGWIRALKRQLWAPPRPGAAKEQDDPFYGSARVLIVDDNPVTLATMTAQMESRGLLPWLAADGAQAVALASELNFDLILMDLQMPVLDGLSATAKIRRFEHGHSLLAVPVIAHSSRFPAADLLTACGFSGILPKPCTEQELEDCLIRWCPTYRPPWPVRSAARSNGRWQPKRPSALR